MKAEQENRFKILKTELECVSEDQFDRALANELIERARLFLSGVKSYLHHPSSRRMTDAPIVWRQGSTRLRDFSLPGAHETAAPVLVIPSLINRLDILDLDEGHSFLRTLAAKGRRVFAVDWDEPGPEELGFSLDDYLAKRLDPILDFLKARETPLHVIGYCMGGCLALALLARQETSFLTLSLLATPWDFHAPDPTIGAKFLALADQIEPTLQSLSYLPIDVIETVFAIFQPMQAFNKFIEFSATASMSKEARHFVLCEDWLNEGVPLAAAVARECLKDWYGLNLTGRFLWRSGDRLIDPRRIKVRALVVVPSKDRLVAKESALPLARLIPHATLLEPAAGHIGMFASARAAPALWTDVIAWLDKER